MNDLASILAGSPLAHLLDTVGEQGPGFFAAPLVPPTGRFAFVTSVTGLGTSSRAEHEREDREALARAEVGVITPERLAVHHPNARSA